MDAHCWQPLLDQTRVRAATERFARLLDLVDTVSFDIFDTLIVRRVAEPRDVFKIIEREWALVGFAEERVRAEANARRVAWEAERRAEITLGEIYNLARIPRHLEAPLMDAEIAAEVRYSRRNEAAYALYQEALDRGKRVVLTSDMYLPLDAIRRILEENGIGGYQDLYLSSDRKVTKASGELFDLVVADAGGDARRVLHIGDNEHSDVKVAEAKGIAPVLFPKIGELRIYDFSRRSSRGSSGHQDVRKIVWHGYAQAIADGGPSEGPEGFWYSIGFRLLCPGLLGFARMIREGLGRSKVDRLFFLSRDGAIIMDTVRKVYPDIADVCEYLVVSRRILNIASLEHLGDHELDFLVSGTTRRSFREFFERVGLSVADIPAEVLERYKPDLDRIVAGADDYRRLRELFLAAKDAIFRIAAQERAALKQYLLRKGWGAGTKVGIVDVGWHASLQRALERLIARGHLESVLVKGFYFGTYRAADNAVPSWSNRVESFMFHYGEPKMRLDAIMSCVEFHELLFADVSFSAVGIDVADGEVAFKYARNEFEEKQFEIVRWLRQGADDAIRYLGEQLAHSSVELDSIREYYASYATEILNRPFPIELRNIGSVVHAEGFDHQSFRPLIVAPSGSGGRAYRTARKLSYWRSGFERLHRRSLWDVF